MSELQKYYVYADHYLDNFGERIIITVVEPDDKDGNYYRVADVDARLVADRATIARLSNERDIATRAAGQLGPELHAKIEYCNQLQATIADLQAKCADLHERLARIGDKGWQEYAEWLEDDHFQLSERLARSEAGNKSLREAIERLRSAGYLGNRWPTYLDSALAVADGQQCEHLATHPGMPKDQPCHYCDGTATVSDEHPDDADEAVFTAQEERIAELEASLDRANTELRALRLKAASDPELRPAVDDQCGGG